MSHEIQPKVIRKKARIRSPSHKQLLCSFSLFFLGPPLSAHFLPISLFFPHLLLSSLPIYSLSVPSPSCICPSFSLSPICLILFCCGTMAFGLFTCWNMDVNSSTVTIFILEPEGSQHQFQIFKGLWPLLGQLPASGLVSIAKRWDHHLN